MLKIFSIIIFLLVSSINIAYAVPATPVIPNVKMLVPIPLDCTGGALACTFTLSTNNTAISFVKVDATATNATINPPGGYTINGLSSYPLDIKGHTIMFILVGTTWYKF